uniref:TAF6-like RNA polymerase II p300/CBP-associated factor-associated factor subunit 6L n=1 Tax=Aceria tosichella TaxID=561515 RepID=A0A6G1SKE4_9ACAR
MQDHSAQVPRVQVNSIKLMAEAAGIAEPSIEAATLISEDVTLRLKQIIIRAFRFMEHSNRKKLTCADINKSLRWSNCQPIFGYECDTNDRIRYSYLAEAQVFKYEDETVDLVEKYQQTSVNVKDLLTDEGCLEAVPELTIEALAINNQMGL